jgi:hypothetical protein
VFCIEELSRHLLAMSDGLNMDYISIDIIAGKVAKGLPQGKFTKNLI